MNTVTPVIVIAPGMLGACVARSLGRLGIPMYGVFGNPRSPSRRSRFWKATWCWDVLSHSDEQSIAFLRSVALEIGSRPILMPIDDDSCLFVARQARELARWFIFPEQPDGLAETLSSKKGMYELCKIHGVPTPETVFPRSPADVEAYIQGGGTFPVMLKSIDTQALQRHAGLRMVTVNDADQLRFWYHRLETPESPNLMIQELIPGDSSAVWMFNGYFDADSRCLFGITGQKLRQYPAYTGATSLGVCVPNTHVENLTKQFMKAVGYHGILDIGYKFDARTGEYKLLDVNPRIGATFRLFTDSKGNDVARILYRDLTGQEAVVGEPIPNRRWLSEAFDIASSWRYYRDGTLSIPAWLRSFTGVNEFMWIALDDPAPFLSLVGLGIGRYARQALRQRLAPQMEEPGRVRKYLPVK